MKHGVINPDLLPALKRLGHGDLLAVVDWANPAYATAQSEDIPLFDFGYAPNVISAQDALAALAQTIAVEKIYFASEMPPTIGKETAESLLGLFPNAERDAMPHETFKHLIARSELIIRTGAPGAYLNFVLQVGAERWE